jgi:hypothetical protein
MNFVCKTLLQNAGPMAVEHEAMHQRFGLWAAYVFTIAGFTSLCLYWCIQRCFYGWAAFIYKIQHTPLGYRDVEDLFLELTQQCCPSVPCILKPLSLSKILVSLLPYQSTCKQLSQHNPTSCMLLTPESSFSI